jgi:hypothetical protein
MNSHFVRMWIGLGVAAFVIVLGSSDWWLPQRASPGALLISLSVLSLPVVFAYTAYQAAAWRAQSATGMSTSGKYIAPSRFMLWLTGTAGLLWWGIAADFLLSLLVTFILFGLMIIQASAIAGRARHTGRRIWPDITACVCILALIVSAAWTAWPMRLLFHASRDQLEALANRVEAGQTVDVPVWVGAFRIARTEIRTPRMRGGTCLWVFTNPGHPTGLVRSDDTSGGGPGHNVNRKIRLSEHWYYISED